MGFSRTGIRLEGDITEIKVILLVPILFSFLESNEGLTCAAEKKTINSELWHACAGPLVSLPPVGSLVVYFPQGHSEQVDFFI